MTVSVVQAIARMEGFGVTNSRAQRNNNPGNVEFKSWMTNLYGARIETVPEGSTETPRFAFFPDSATGWKALRDLLVRGYAGMTVADAFNKYAPPVENQTNQYIGNVCQWCELTPETILNADNIG